MQRRSARSGIAILLLGLAGGCTTGPELIQASRTQYNVALRQTASDRRQYLKDVLSVSCGLLQPATASVGVTYRDHWFYIDDADLVSKGTFALVNIVFAIQSGNVDMPQPVLTIPVIR